MSCLRSCSRPRIHLKSHLPDGSGIFFEYLCYIWWLLGRIFRPSYFPLNGNSVLWIQLSLILHSFAAESLAYWFCLTPRVFFLWIGAGLGSCCVCLSGLLNIWCDELFSVTVLYCFQYSLPLLRNVNIRWTAKIGIVIRRLESISGYTIFLCIICRSLRRVSFECCRASYLARTILDESRKQVSVCTWLYIFINLLCSHRITQE